MAMTRRSFLGILGGVAVLAASPEIFLSIPEPVAPTIVRAWITYIRLEFPAQLDPAIIVIRRRAGADLIRAALAPQTWFVWAAPMGAELVIPQGIAALEIDAPPEVGHEICWYDATGAVWQTCNGQTRRLRHERT